ncbi:hypothetical protein [Paenibacillus sp. FSL H8-0332]|uniref:hypothetical protein n=1 Tax=Paenibacillus sp. FSL H8-0332 TaxID=2954742 RepID=UPI0030D16BDE
MAPTLEVLQRLIIDQNAVNGSGEDKGGNRFKSLDQRLFPRTVPKRELDQASDRITVSIGNYKDTSKEIQDEILNNRFAEFLIYDRGADNEGH